MTNTRDLILKLKAVREEKKLSYTDIMTLIEKNNQYLSKSTISRVFAEGSEELSFKYEETIRPIANALLDIENIEEDDNMDVKAMKTLLKYKDNRIMELESQLEQLQRVHDAETVKLHEKMDNERESWARSIEFLKNQIDLKDKRMDMLLKAVLTDAQDKEYRHDELIKLILSCPCRTKANNKEE